MPDEKKPKQTPRFKLDVITPTLTNAVETWADARTSATSARRHDLLRDKYNALLSDGKDGTAAGFFMFAGKPVEAITPDDIKAWQDYMESMELSAASIYARVSRVSSFYEWLMTQPDYRDIIKVNPAKSARPKAPKAYQSAGAKALSDEDVQTLLQYVHEQSLGDNISAKRDNALLRFYFATGKRRSEIINLRWRDLDIGTDHFTIRTEDDDGTIRETIVRDMGVIAALMTYLRASDRWDDKTNAPRMEATSPLWLRHDRAAKGQQPVTSHGFVYMLKKYAKECGLGNIHLQQMRHTVARMVGEQGGDISELQNVLGHQNAATTRVYMNRIARKGDDADDDNTE